MSIFGSSANPAEGVFVITPSDVAPLPRMVRGIRANVAGVVSIVGADGQPCLCNFLAGETRAIRVSAVMFTGTTATGLEGLI